MPDQLRDQLQSSLGSTYALERELGGGGMSRVFVARDESLGRTVVVKVLAPELLEGLSVERFTREIRLAAGLQEPHIVPVIAAGNTASGLPYYTMPFVEGESLRARMTAGRVTTTQAIAILRDVANALAYAHTRGIVHRDIKPENILLSSGTAVVTDFGIAKAMQLSRTQAPGGPAFSALTGTGTSLGTPAYMAPEQAAGDPNTDQRADIYAWGVVAYELLTGAHPFASRTTPQQLLAAHMTETPALLSTRASEVPDGIAALVMRALAKDPSERPGSAAELLAALDAIGPSPLNMSRVEVRWPRVVAASVVFALLLAAGYIWQRPQRVSIAPADVPVMMAVLPFEHEGPEDQRPFTNGLTDAVTAKLSGLKSLAVIDRRSAASYRGSTKTAKQIGAELGVTYLLQGIVRWAKDGSGEWKARVTSTLIDAKTGVIKWNGDPADITLEDPFTAQGTIATDVVKQMQVQLLPEERRSLTRKFSDNPQAFAAFQRGVSIISAADASSATFDPATYEAGAKEFEVAVSLDSGFGAAWGKLASNREFLAVLSSGDSTSVSSARKVIEKAMTMASEEPMVMLALANHRLMFDRDSTGVDSLIAGALRRSPNDATLYTNAAAIENARGRPERAFALAERAAKLDPRSPMVWMVAAQGANLTGRHELARRYSTLLESIDSTSEWPYAIRLDAAVREGDTLRMQAELDRANSLLPHSTYLIRGYLAYAGTKRARDFLATSAVELAVVTVFDSANTYFDSKTDAALALGELQLARIYSDSVRRLLRRRQIGGFDAGPLGVLLAFAEANAGAVADARSTLAQALRAAGATTSEQLPVHILPPTLVAGTYARLGDIDNAIRWLEAGLTAGYTSRGYRIAPKLRVLHGNAAFEAFLRRYPE